MAKPSGGSLPNLNAPQRAAVEHEQGPLLVLAGAGSGKTRVITHRIARLVERGTRPEAILAVSFTNKAAAEMAERMVPLVGAPAAAKLVLCTFHSFGVRFLNEEREALGYGGRFVIFDQGDSLGLVREILRQERRGSDLRKLDAAAILTRISLWKNAFVAPSEVRETDFEYDEVAREIYPRYESQLRAMHAVDFDDLVVVPVRILRDHETVREKWRDRFRHLLVDEFQDTNRSQLELVRLLANRLRNVCVVGDDDQSIYGWRGADVGNILDFEQHFPGTKIVKLEDNYRSRAPILDVANAAIARSTQKRHGKVLRAARGGGDQVRVVVSDDADTEARYVAGEIAELKRFGDVAVLYRSNLQARHVEEALRTRGVPYRLFGGTQLFDRKEVKDAAAYLRVALNPRDELSLRRILNYPARGIGDTTIERAEQQAKRSRRRFGDVALQLDQLDADVPDAAKRAAGELRGAIERARARFESGRDLAATAREMLREVKLETELREGDASEKGAAAQRRWDNVEFLLGALDRYEKSPRPDKPSLANFLAFVTMRAETPGESEEELAASKNVVTLSTLHASKGLEFPIVFLIGCVEGQLPHSRTTDPKVSEAAPTDVEEERRLFYVGVTRARERLYLTRPRRRVLRGKPTPLTPSRFLDGLPEEHLEHVEHVDRPPMAHEEIEQMAAALLAKLGG